MPLDTKDYMHPQDCKCPACTYRRQHILNEIPVGQKLKDKDWKKLIKKARKADEKRQKYLDTGF
jgi:hypothetical protein